MRKNKHIICKKLKINIVRVKGTKIYEEGIVRCTHCAVYMKETGINQCPCCGYKLKRNRRTKNQPNSPSNKRKQEEIKKNQALTKNAVKEWREQSVSV